MFQHGGIDISHVRVDVAGDCCCLCNVPVLLSSVYAEPCLARAHGARDMDGRGTKAQGREDVAQTMQGIARHPAWDTRDVLARHLPQKGCMEKTGR